MVIDQTIQLFNLHTTVEDLFDGKVLNREQARRPAKINIHSWLSGEKQGM